MISSQILSDFYSVVDFQTSSDFFIIHESDRSATIKEAKFFLSGIDFNYCGDAFWSKSEDLYQRSSQEFKFRKHCDGFAIFSYQEQNYLVWIELKSGFNEVFNNAIFQISACYTKMKSYLNNFSSYNSADYKEFGIVVSMPENDHNDSGIETNEIISGRRNLLIKQSESVKDKTRRLFRKTGMINIDGKDFGANKLQLRTDILPDNLPVFHCAASSGTVDIDLKLIIAKVNTL